MSIIGHQAQQDAFRAAWDQGKVHHAWLLTGPPGIGKASVAGALARFVLTDGKGPPHPALALMEAGSHPDFRVLQRGLNDRGALRAEIVVEQVRELQSLFQSKPGFGGWRVVLVDAADEMNRSSSNAFLKNLEEPPEKTLFLLVSHNPVRLLPTIRSRCRTLRFQPLGEPDVRAVLTRALEESSAAEIEALVALAEGSPGRALRFAGLDVQKLTLALSELSRGGGDAMALARSLAGKTAQARYEAFVELVPAFIAGAARTRTGASLARTLQLWEKAHALAAEAVPLAYDPQVVAFELAGYVGELDNPR
ncbi:DNA polymerase III subunit delta' [Sphingosinicella soli]|uniref:DNA polymerase-3 subunit delta n=1 Tax=Sphingosinicella soli TaxID=333708 RepID=A0A7W7F5H6_9SPHN|nr:DNA polymerase-3 subunit delta' [Sphingosinicella soli]